MTKPVGHRRRSTVGRACGTPQSGAKPLGWSADHNRISGVSQPEYGEGDILVGVTGSVGHNSQDSGACCPEGNAEEQVGHFTGGGESMSRHGSGNVGAVELGPQGKGRRDCRTGFHCDGTLERNLVYTGFRDLDIRGARRMGDGCAGYQGVLIEGQSASGDGRLPCGIGGCQDFRRTAASCGAGISAGDYKVEYCILICAAVDDFCRSTWFAGGNRAYRDGGGRAGGACCALGAGGTFRADGAFEAGGTFRTDRGALFRKGDCL